MTKPLPAPLRVTYLVDAPAWGGAEAYLSHLLRTLPIPVQPAVLAADPAPPQLLRELAALAPVQLVPAVADKRDLRNALALVCAVRATRPDLIHVNLNSPANNRYGLAAALLSRGPTVATLHYLLPLSSLQRGTLGVGYRRVRRAVAVSTEIREWLIRELRVPAERVTMIPNGIPMTSSRRPPSAAVPRPVRVGTLARLTRQKGIDVLVAAVRLLVEQGGELTVTVGGEGEDADVLRAAAAGLPVQLQGFVDDTSAWLAGLDVFCLPSRREGLPFALLEAMMAGLPCVVTDVGELRAALGPGGLVVPPEDPESLAAALASLLHHPAKRASLGQAAREHVVAHYSAEAMARATAAVYLDAVKDFRALRPGFRPGRRVACPPGPIREPRPGRPESHPR